MEIGERIKAVRKHFKLTQAEFGERIGVKGNTIATYEIGRNAPVDAIFSLLCREYGVNEIWLRSGEGDMFQAMTEDEELSDYLGDVMHDEPESFLRRLTLEMKNWAPEVWQMIEEVCKRLATEKPDTE